MKKKNAFHKILSNFDAVLTGLTLSLCVIIVNVNVFMRYALNHPLQWCDEVVTGLFVWTVFIGSAYAYRKHSHLGVDIITNMMGPKLKQVVTLIVAFLELAILIMLTIISAQYVYNLIYVRGVFRPVVTDMLRFPKWWISIAVPIGFGLSTIYSVYFLLTDKLHIIKLKPKPVDGDEYQVQGGNF